MTADPTTLALLREARDSVEFEMLTTGQADRRERARERLARIDAYLSAGEVKVGAVEWVRHSRFSFDEAYIGNLRLMAWPDGLWGVEQVTSREQMIGKHVAEGYAPTKAEAKRAAEEAAGVR